MKKQALRKLAAYSAMAVPFLLTSENINAQVFYVDLDPDEEIEDGDNFFIDFNDDGINEVHLFQQNASFPCYGGMGLDEYEVHVATDGNGFHKAFDPGSPITFAFTTDYNIVYFNYYYETLVGSEHELKGPLIGLGDQYIGLYFEDGPNTFYAWMRVNVDTCSYIVKDYAWSPEPLFAGEGAFDECAPPVPVGSIPMSPTSVKVKWNAVPGAVKYQIKYRPVGAPTWLNKTVDAPALIKKLNGLVCDTDYEWKIRTQCADGSLSAYSALQNFTTADCRIGGVTEDAEMTLYPNPAGTAVTIDVAGLDEEAMINIYDLSGKLLFTRDVEFSDEFIYHLDVNDLANGIYMIQVSSGNVSLYQQLVVQK